MNIIDQKSLLTRKNDEKDSATICELRHIVKVYHGAQTPAVRDLNLTIRDGEFLTLLGPSGSGKTTTLMMLAGFERPSEGQILLKGEDITYVAPHKRGLGVVFQSYALFPHMSVFENVAFPLSVRGVNKADISSRVNRTLEVVKLAALADRQPRQLSGGQQQRVALARALVFDPPVVLMDEPLGALDRQLREHMQIEISRLHRDLGVTVIYVTHDQDEALTMSDRVAVFNGGLVRQLSSPKELYDHPNDEFVARFVGENNNIEGTVAAVEGGGRCRVLLADGTPVRAMGMPTLVEGAAVFVSLRPERVHCGVPAAEGGFNVLKGTVSDVVFRGDHVRLSVLTPSVGELNARIPRADLREDLVQGAEIDVHWSASQCLAIPQTGSIA
ncbi:MAG: ABC transporter ATP-binding protein [Nitratireductor sp.]